MIIFLVVCFIVIAFVLGLRDKYNARKYLLSKLIKNYGNPPAREYKADASSSSLPASASISYQ